MKIIDNIPVWGDPVDENAVLQMKNTLNYLAYRGAIMADHHQGYCNLPVGGVVAYDGFVNASGVGSDISCGNKAVLLDVDHVEIRKNIGKIMDDIFSHISFGVGRANNERVEHEIFDNELFKEPLGRQLRQLAINQLGTVGSGNHYVDLFVDELNRVWCGVHFGSRGLGFNIAKHFISDIGGGKQDVFADPVLFDLGDDLGRDYWRWMTLAGEYAYAGRDWVCSKVSEIIGANIVEEVHNNHNFAWIEECDGKDLCVVRKGCTPAFPGQKGFVGGSMGDISVILQGKDTEENKLGLYSTVHGAGRIMGRAQAKGKFKPVKDASGNKTGEYECVREPQIKKEDMKNWLKEKGVTLRGADVDEAPQAYKRLPEVIKHHENSIEILHTLTPIGVCMSPPHCRDPYKD